jgi:hypothetical protein
MFYNDMPLFDTMLLETYQLLSVNPILLQQSSMGGGDVELLHRMVQK